jgi:elongation factor Ts
MAISAADVRNLREKTGAPMMDCKKALEATDGDITAAEDHLRKLGLKAAGKKVGRATGEGRCYIKTDADAKRGAMVAVGCETDFVAATEDYNKFLEALCDHVLEHRSPSVEALLAESWAAGGTVQDALTETIGKLGENMGIANVKFVEAPEGFVGGYIHHNNKVGVISALKTGADRDQADAVLKQIGMHAAALPPTALSRDDIDPELVEREKAIYREEVKNKPEDIQDKIIGGKLNKFYAGVALREQPWVMDDSMSVEKAVEKALGSGTVIVDYARFTIGE